MKVKTKKTIKKRYSLSHPKQGGSKVLHEAQGFAHGSGKKRKFRLFRGRNDRAIENTQQESKIKKEIF